MTIPTTDSGPGYYILADLEKPFSFEKLFGNSNPVELEIGAGRGDFLVGYCEENRGINLAAVERKLNYLKRGVNKVRDRGLTNVCFLNLEVRHFLEEYVPDDSLQAVHIYFPDPWPKKRHLKRRLFQHDLIPLLAARIKLGGVLHLRTDHPGYFEQMMEVMAAQDLFERIEVPAGLLVHKTGFERRFLEDGVSINYASYKLHKKSG